MFTELKKNCSITNELNWLIHSCDTAAKWERSFYNNSLNRFNQMHQQEIINIFQNAKEDEVEAILYELLTHELLWHLDFKPNWHPDFNGQTPDLSFDYNNQLFIADCYVIHSPKKTIKNKPSQKSLCSELSPKDQFVEKTITDNLVTGWSFDRSKSGESRSDKLYKEIEKKVSKYRSIDLPLIVFVFAGDLHQMDAQVLERTLYGRSTSEVANDETFPSVGREPMPTGGLLLPIENECNRFPNLAAAIWCDWFWSLKKNPKRKRLSCTVCHHWAPNVSLPYPAFEPLFQIGWESAKKGEWVRKYMGDRNYVVGFEDNVSLVCKPYSNEAPW